MPTGEEGQGRAGREGSVGFGGCAPLPLHGITSPSSTLPLRPLLALQNLLEPSCALEKGAPFSRSVPPCIQWQGKGGGGWISTYCGPLGGPCVEASPAAPPTVTAFPGRPLIALHRNLTRRRSPELQTLPSLTSCHVPPPALQGKPSARLPRANPLPPCPPRLTSSQTGGPASTHAQAPPRTGTVSGGTETAPYSL